MIGRLAILLVVVTLAAVAACGGNGDDAAGGKKSTLTVFAAASLVDPFEQLGDLFEAQHDEVNVEFNFAGSADLASQISNGAPADVFAPADEVNMAKLNDEVLTGSDPKVFATNRLLIAVPPENPANITSFQDLADADLNLVMCAPQVPCGAAAQMAAAFANIELKPVSEEQSVTDVLAKVVSAEADAGLVYATDIRRAGKDALGIEFPESDAAVNRYPIATVMGSEHAADVAQDFIDLALSDAGQKILADAGFGRP